MALHMEPVDEAPLGARDVAELRRSLRLSLPFGLRLPFGTGIAFLGGSGLGLAHGSQTAGWRFRAENAHRLPRTTTGWYLYHKSKNYHMMFGGVTEGLKMGGKLSLLAGAFFTVEEAVDRTRGTRDCLSTVIAGLGIAGGWSLWNRFPIQTAARTAKAGLLFGLAYGLAQDVLSLARGRRPGYVDVMLGRRRTRNRPETRPEMPG
ncbi:MAG: hypothetical protein M1838_006193 [Thelocarpon superellum]|nr:MAG: hypothetical protein M1838_006193 [Thelocarpon superellum]